MDRRPIGVFDSGIGGLTVVRELHRQLPHESLIYFGDTARVPYGNKSPDTVRRYAREILDFLAGRDVKMVVVACNTASAHALESLKAATRLPVEGVVGPGARAAVAATKGGTIGVIGTAGTMKSGAYARAIHALKPQARVVERACPSFVPLVEEGWLDRDATRLVAREYLDPLKDESCDTLVLGCTHYPLLKPLIADVVGPGVTMIDSAEQTAAAVARELKSSNLETDQAGEGHTHFVVSDAPEQFARVGQMFLGDRVRDIEVVAL